MVGNIWSILVEAVNTNLYINQTIHKIDKRRKPTSIQELQQFYGIIILMENTYGNNTQDCRTHFFILKKTYENIWPSIGIDRFEALMRYKSSLNL